MLDLLTLIFIVTVLNSAGIIYLIVRKPRTVGPPNKAMQQIGSQHRTCGVCGAVVARYTPREDGSVVCLNCKPFGS